MFYVKQKLSEDAEINIEITDENVFNHCPCCGREVLVDLDEVLSDGEGDLFSTTVFCDDCAAEWQKHAKQENRDGEVKTLKYHDVNGFY